MRKAQARANILAQDPSQPQSNANRETRQSEASNRNDNLAQRNYQYNQYEASNYRQYPPQQQQHQQQQHMQHSAYVPSEPQPRARGQRSRPPNQQMQNNYSIHGQTTTRINNGYYAQPYANQAPQDYNAGPSGGHYTDTNIAGPVGGNYLPAPRHVSHGGYYYNHQQDSDAAHVAKPNDRVNYPEYLEEQHHPRSMSYQGPSAAKHPGNQQQRSFSSSNNAYGDNTMESETDKKPSFEDQNKIKELEQKIQNLERLMAAQALSSTSVQTLESINASNDNVSMYTKPLNIPKDHGMKDGPATPDIAQSKDSEELRFNNAPPLPPPPPAEQKSLNNSPKANLFVTDLESRMQANLENGCSRLSASSLIPTDKSVSDQSLDEQGDEEGVDEPPPSYEELEKSGSLTYSKSIYRTGFEKAGYQMDHVPSPISPTESNLTSKRKIPPAIQETAESLENSIAKNDVSSLSKTLSPPIPIPAARPAPIRRESQESAKEPISKNNTEKRFTDDSLYMATSQIKNTKTTDKGNFVKYSTPFSFKTQNHGVIEPILPSKSEELDEQTISRFRTTREQALKDYGQFTPKIQFFWAILLIETLSNQSVLSKMAIDGKLRKTPLSFKKLEKQRSMFLNTAIKVLEKTIQVAPDDTRARLYLGDIYSGGIHPGIIDRDEKKGFQFFYDAACKQNDPVACYRVACCLESGVGCEQDVVQSTLFFQKGADLGDPSSMCQLGMMHFAGVSGCNQDINISIKYHKDAYGTLRDKEIMAYDPLISLRSYQDARGALYTLAKIYQTDRHILCLADGSAKSIRMIKQMKETEVWCHNSRALKYYLEAAKLGHSESQASLGYYYSQGYFPTMNFKSDKEAHSGEPDALDARKSIYWFSKAASDGHIYASLGLAKWYGSGAEGVLKKDEQQAFLWGRKAADAGGLPEAEFMIGMCFETGFGIPKNPTMARNYYERSASKGYRKAKDKLRML